MNVYHWCEVLQEFELSLGEMKPNAVNSRDSNTLDPGAAHISRTWDT